MMEILFSAINTVTLYDTMFALFMEYVKLLILSKKDWS